VPRGDQSSYTDQQKRKPDEGIVISGRDARGGEIVLRAAAAARGLHRRAGGLRGARARPLAGRNRRMIRPPSCRIAHAFDKT